MAMMFCQLAQAKSLREIIDGLACCEGKLNHLGLQEGPKRSTLSYANSKRPWELFEHGVSYDIPLIAISGWVAIKILLLRSTLFALEMSNLQSSLIVRV